MAIVVFKALSVFNLFRFLSLVVSVLPLLVSVLPILVQVLQLLALVLLLLKHASLRRH